MKNLSLQLCHISIHAILVHSCSDVKRSQRRCETESPTLFALFSHAIHLSRNILPPPSHGLSLAHPCVGSTNPRVHHNISSPTSSCSTPRRTKCYWWIIKRPVSGFRAVAMSNPTNIHKRQWHANCAKNCRSKH